MFRALPTNYQAAEIAEPSEGAFHVPTVPMSLQVRFSPGMRVTSPPLWDAGADASATQPGKQRFAITSLIHYQDLGTLFGTASAARYTDAVQDRLCQLDFRPLGTGHQSPQAEGGVTQD